MGIEMQIALIGILGTLAGTVLGWILNNLSQIGKLNMYISLWENKFVCNRSGYMEPSLSLEETESYTYKLVLDLYNSSSNMKIMRDIRIVLKKGKEVLRKDVPQDDTTRRVSHGLSFYDDITCINVPPKSVMTIQWHGGFWKEKNDTFDSIWDTDNVCLTYKDEKNKERQFLLHKECYRNYFENHNVEIVGNV